MTSSKKTLSTGALSGHATHAAPKLVGREATAATLLIQTERCTSRRADAQPRSWPAPPQHTQPNGRPGTNQTKSHKPRAHQPDAGARRHPCIHHLRRRSPAGREGLQQHLQVVQELLAVRIGTLTRHPPRQQPLLKQRQVAMPVGDAKRDVRHQPAAAAGPSGQARAGQARGQTGAGTRGGTATHEAPAPAGCPTRAAPSTSPPGAGPAAPQLPRPRPPPAGAAHQPAAGPAAARRPPAGRGRQGGPGGGPSGARTRP
jgi:hypothetical protein